MASHHLLLRLDLLGTRVVSARSASDLLAALRTRLLEPQLRLRPAPSVAQLNLHLSNLLSASGSVTVIVETLALPPPPSPPTTPPSTPPPLPPTQPPAPPANSPTAGADLNGGGSVASSADDAGLVPDVHASAALTLGALLAPSLSSAAEAALTVSVGAATPAGLLAPNVMCAPPADAHRPSAAELAASGLAPSNSQGAYSLRFGCVVELEWSIAADLDGPSPPIVFPQVSSALPPRTDLHGEPQSPEAQINRSQASHTALRAVGSDGGSSGGGGGSSPPLRRFHRHRLGFRLSFEAVASPSGATR